MTALELAAAPVEAKDSAVANFAVLARAQAGDEQARADLYRMYFGGTFRFVLHRVGDWHTVQDLAADVFVRAYARIHTVSWQGKDPGAWFTTIARNVVADHFKSARFRLERLTGEPAGFDRCDEDRAVDPELAVGAYLSNLNLLAAVNRLGAEQREAIVLRFLCGLSVAETALQMGKQEGAVKALTFRAVRALARDEAVLVLAGAA